MRGIFLLNGIDGKVYNAMKGMYEQVHSFKHLYKHHGFMTVSQASPREDLYIADRFPHFVN
jgi:hypothetical protein